MNKAMETDKGDVTNGITNGIGNEEPQLLGSVTTYNSIDGAESKSQQIRSSARVFKKMKLDLSQAVVVTEKKEKKEEIKPDVVKKCFRPLWSTEDKNLFFEALNEYGKDFENIQLYISSKLRKKGVPDYLIKTKDQVRHLYYRTWHKVSKHLKFSENIKKVVQELYALINYGELKKKIGTVNEKFSMKLNDLIYKGSTVVRKKGKNIRVKTPMCRALRRLNQLDENYEEIQLPNRVMIELRPRDMSSYLKVQSQAQNPRIRTVLPLQKRISSLIACISKKWKGFEANDFDKAIVSTCNVTNDLVPKPEMIEENRKLLQPVLRLTPPKDTPVEVPSINLSEYFTRQSICLSSYENRLNMINEEYNLKGICQKNNPKKIRARTDSLSDKSDKTPSKQVKIETVTEEKKTDLTSVSEVVDEAVNTILALQMERIEEPEKTEEEIEEKKEVLRQDEAETIMNERRAAKIEAIRKGWSEEESQFLTVGEVYLMCGKDSKLVLEYSWDSIKHPEPEEVQDEKKVAELAEEAECGIKPRNDLSVPLSKLLSLAKMHYRKNVIKCPCGHVCGQKNNVQIKKAMATKIRKILTDIDKCNDEPEEKPQSEEQIFENEASFIAPRPVNIPKLKQLTPYFHPPNPPSGHFVSQLNSIQRIKPKYCNRRGRKPRSKQVVVERKLPLLPNNLESGHQIVRMNIISQDNNKLPSAAPMPVLSASAANSEQILIDANTPVFIEEQGIPLPRQVELEIPMDTSRNVTDLGMEDNAMSTAPSSPSRLLRENEDQWINSEVVDYSLSSLLGHLESPMKTTQLLPNTAGEDTRLSNDVDVHLQSLLTESSLDFSVNFADLAAQVTNETKKMN